MSAAPAAGNQHVLILGGLSALVVALPLAARAGVRITVIDDRPADARHEGEFISAADFPDTHDDLLGSILVAEWEAVILSVGQQITQPQHRVGFIHEAQVRAELAQAPASLALVAAAPNEVHFHGVSTDRGTFSADVVIDARAQDMHPGGVHVLTCTVALTRPHKLRQPILIDTETASGTGWSFFQYLPVASTHLQIRAVGHGRSGGKIAVAANEGKLLQSCSSCIPLIPERSRAGKPIVVPYGCPDPIFPSAIPMALATGVALAKAPSLAEADLRSALAHVRNEAIRGRSRFLQECQELAAVKPSDRTGHPSYSR